MEDGLYLVPGEQRGGVAAGRRHAGHVVDDGTDVLATVVVGFLHGFHPSALSLDGTGQVVGHEDGEVLALGILDVINLDLWVVLGSIGHLLEGEAVELVGGKEDTVLDNAVEREVGTHVILAEVEFLFFHLLGIVVIVAGLDLGGIAMLGGILLHVGHFLVHLLDSGAEERHQQVFGSLRGLGHVRIHSVVGIGIEAEQVSLLLTQEQDVADVLGIVPLVAMVGSRGVGLIHHAAQVAILGIGQHGKAGRCGSGKCPLTLLALVGSELGGIVDDALGQPLELLFLLDEEDTVVHVVHHVVAELELVVTQLAVDFLEGVLLGSSQQGSIAHKLLVVLLGEALLDGIHAQLVGVVIDGFHLDKQAVVHVHAVALCGEHGQQLLRQLLHLGGVVAAAQGIEHAGHLVQDAAAVVQGQDGVLKIGLCRVLDNRIDLGVLLLDTGFYSRLVITVGDFVKRRNAVLVSILRHKRIVLG